MRVTVDFDPSNRDDVGRFLSLADLLRTPKGEAAPTVPPTPLWDSPEAREQAITALVAAYESPGGGPLHTRLYRVVDTMRPTLRGPLPLRTDDAVQRVADILMEHPTRPCRDSAALAVDMLAKACLSRLTPSP